MSEKLQRLLDGFLDGVLEREIYTQKKAEIMSQKKTLEEQMSDLALGNLEWVEPLKNWLEKAVSICKIAHSTDQNAKKSLLLEIFGLNLILKNKNTVASSDPKSHSPQENIWFGFRQTQQKIRSASGNLEKSRILEHFYRNARTHFSKNHQIRTDVKWRKEDNLRNQPRRLPAKG